MLSIYKPGLVSIIATTYNGSLFIGETVESVSRQTYTDWELLIIDDGSTDNTREIVRSIHHPGIRLIEAGRVAINGKLKNIGLKEAKGEFLAFIDHDDLWHPAKLQRQIDALRQHPEAGFSLTGGYNFRGRGEIVEYFYRQKEGSLVANLFLPLFRSEIAVWTQALLVRRNCISEMGGFVEDAVFADPEFVMRLAYHYQAVLLYESLFFHRLHETNYTLLNWEASHREGIRTLLSFRKRKMLPPGMAREVLFRSHIHFGEKCLQRGLRKKSLLSFIGAWRQKPLNFVPIKKMVKAIVR